MLTRFAILTAVAFALAACGGVSNSKFNAAISARDRAQADTKTAEQRADAAEQRAVDLATPADNDSDGIPDDRDFYPAYANAGLAAGNWEPYRAAADENLEDLLANPKNTFRAYSATVRRHYQNGMPQFVRASDRDRIVSVSSDGDYGFRIVYRDEENDTETEAHLRKTDLGGMQDGLTTYGPTTYGRNVPGRDDGSQWGYWSFSGKRFDGASYGTLNPAYTVGVFNGTGFQSFLLYGLETRPANLPAGTASYSGSMHAYSYDNNRVSSEGTFASSSIRSWLRGSVTLDMDFTNNVLSGRIDGLSRRGPGESEHTALPETTGFDIVSGNIAGSQFGAAMTGTDTDATAPLSDSMRGFQGRLLGSFYGAEAERAQGVFNVSREDSVMIGAIYTR